MRSELIDWSVIRNALIGLIASIGVGAGLVVGSVYFEERMQQEYYRNNAQFQSISQRYLAMDEEKRLINEYSPEFQRLYERGVIGEERRLDWIEVLRDAGNSLKLPALSYTIESQKSYVPAYPINLSSYNLMHSTMRLNLTLLHEGDLFSLLETLNRRAPGSFTVTACRLNNNVPDDAGTADATRGNVNAECTLDWFTLRPAGGLDLEA